MAGTPPTDERASFFHSKEFYLAAAVIVVGLGALVAWWMTITSNRHIEPPAAVAVAPLSPPQPAPKPRPAGAVTLAPKPAPRPAAESPALVFKPAAPTPASPAAVPVPGPTYGPGAGPTSAPASTPSAHMLLGNPSGATANPTNRDNFLMAKPFYALAYNNAKGTPNWVSWRVTIEDLGTAERRRGFDPDTMLPPGFTRIEHKDYGSSGFDRGHMCPHADRAATDEMSFATFTMTNIIPQAPKLNQGAWADLEDFSRRQVVMGNRVNIIAGPAGKGGHGEKPKSDTIANGRVTVPATCWKVIVIVPADGGDDDLAKINAQSRVISVMMPNDNSKISAPWKKWICRTSDIEKVTGYKFFTTLKLDLANQLREKVDDGK